MKYTKKDMGSYNLHMINTKKFKTVTLTVLFRRKIEKNEITLRNVLSEVMGYTTNKYDSKKKMAILTEELYGLAGGIRSFRVGNYINTEFSINVLNDKYTEEGNLKKAIEFINESIFNPDVEASSFKEKNVELQKAIIKTNLSGLKEDPRSYANVRALEEFTDEPISYRMFGYLEDLENINGKELYKYYQDMLKKDLVDIFVVGDINEDEISKQVKEYFKLKLLKKQRLDYEVENKKARSKVKEVSEKLENSQSIVKMIYRVGNLSDYEKRYVLPIVSGIFGEGTDSKLFKIVREKHSLCYGISSRSSRFDNTLIVSTGINLENKEKTIKLVDELFTEMKKGKFTEQDINFVKEYIETSFDQKYKSPRRVIERYMAEAFLGNEPDEIALEKYKNVTKQEIVKVAKKITLDTIYTLEGDKEDEEVDY